jgi:hypothetical protein
MTEIAAYDEAKPIKRRYRGSAAGGPAEGLR